MERLPVVLELLEQTRGVPGDALILAESQADAATLTRRLERLGIRACLYPDEWAEAAAGGRVVVGTRNVSFAPGRRSAIVVLDAHSESYRSERAPTFDARAVVAERAAPRADTAGVRHLVPERGTTFGTGAGSYRPNVRLSATAGLRS